MAPPASTAPAASPWPPPPAWLTSAGCQIVGPAGTYTITATAPGLTADQASFSITVGAPTQLAFTIQPGGGPNGTVWTTQPVVTVEDSGGNTVATSTDTITLAIHTQPGSGATLTCNGGLPVAATAGIASFAGCQIVGPAGNYTIKATDTTNPSLSPALSFRFLIS